MNHYPRWMLAGCGALIMFSLAAWVTHGQGPQAAYSFATTVLILFVLQTGVDLKDEQAKTAEHVAGLLARESIRWSNDPDDPVKKYEAEHGPIRPIVIPTSTPIIINPDLVNRATESP